MFIVFEEQKQVASVATDEVKQGGRVECGEIIKVDRDQIIWGFILSELGSHCRVLSRGMT